MPRAHPRPHRRAPSPRLVLPAAVLAAALGAGVLAASARPSAAPRAPRRAGTPRPPSPTPSPPAPARFQPPPAQTQPSAAVAPPRTAGPSRPRQPPAPSPSPSPPPAALVLEETFESFAAGESWAEGTVHGTWRTVFTGYGAVGVTRDGTNVLSLAPQAAGPGETHAALVASTQTFGDLDLTVRLRTVRQLRAGPPNPWEVGWVLWAYTDNTHFSYLVLKPNGWELGKADPAYPGAQRFLATGTDRTFPPGPWYEVHVRAEGATVSVWADGTLLVQFTDTGPSPQGAVALYTEDAEVHFDDVRVGPAR